MSNTNTNEIPYASSSFLTNFSEVEAKKATPETLRQMIKDVLKSEGDKCWREMLPLMLPPGLSGSREYDHAYAVGVLLKHDALIGGRIALFMNTNNMPRRMLWDEIVKVCRQVGFRIHNGRLIGLLEDKSDENGGHDAGSYDSE